MALKLDKLKIERLPSIVQHKQYVIRIIDHSVIAIPGDVTAFHHRIMPGESHNQAIEAMKQIIDGYLEKN